MNTRPQKDNGAEDMHECERMRRISAFHDGEVEEEERRQIEEHLRVCVECNAEQDRLRSLSGLLATVQTPRLSTEALCRFHGAASGVSERVVFRMARGFAVAAAVLLAACLVWLWRAGTTQDVYYARVVPEWERTAVMPRADVAGETSPEVQIAQWIVADLSRENSSE